MVQKHIINCCSPKRIRNKYTGEWFTVGCGKCSACLNSRHERAVAMMKAEENCHKYAFFCTLTYNDVFVPRLYRSDDGLFLFDPDSKHHGISCLPIRDEMLSMKDMNWLRKKRYFEYSRFSDFQRFLKRFRQNFLRMCPFEDVVKQLKSKNNYAQIRYYGSAEYGPETIRPHFHCILYFDSDWLAENFGEVFFKSWSTFDRRSNKYVCLGQRSSFRPCKGDSSDRYTASYCDGFVGVPEFYKCPELRPKHSYSKAPSLGTLSFDTEKISQVFYSGALRQYSGVNYKTNEAIIDFLPRSVENKLFPKCCGFSRIDDRSRMFLYRILPFVAQRNGGSLNYCDFRDYLSSHHDYFESFHNPKLSIIFKEQAETMKPYFGLWSVSKRFFNNTINFNISPSEYLGRISDYYSLKSYYRLRDFYEFVEDFSKREHFSLAYSLHEGVSRELEANLSSSKDFQNLVINSTRIQNDGCKTKKERDRQDKGNAIEYIPDPSYFTRENLLHLFNKPL